jgi:hypothetical protein
MPGQKMKTGVSCRAYGSGRASRRSRNTMRVKPYPIRSPSLNARHAALPAPGGPMSTSGCSCRYRSSLRTWSGGPGGTSCTGQYRYRVSGQRNGFPRSPATRHRRRSHERIPPSWTLPVPMTTLYHRRICSGRQAAPIHHRTADYRRAPVRLSGAQIGGRPAHPNADVSEFRHRILMQRPASPLVISKCRERYVAGRWYPTLGRALPTMSFCLLR